MKVRRTRELLGASLSGRFVDESVRNVEITLIITQEWGFGKRICGMSGEKSIVSEDTLFIQIFFPTFCEEIGKKLLLSATQNDGLSYYSKKTMENRTI